MIKTIDDYKRDLDISGEPEALREVHAIRSKLHEERKGISVLEYNKLSHKWSKAFLGKNSGEKNL